MRTLLPCLILFLCYLILERFALARSQRRIPHRIAITGTRGKSSVARLLASVLKEDGRRVVAKTTGSEAMVLLPDGAGIELDRSVGPSILEQKQLVHRAARLKADCLVAEIMSIRPENHFVESRRLLRPNLVAITNVRRDHTDLMGDTEEKIASVLCLDICDRSAVFLAEREKYESFRAEAKRRNATLIPVPAGSSAPLLQGHDELSRLEFQENLDLVCAVAGHLGVGRRAIVDGIRKAQHDIGRLRIWSYRRGEGGCELFLVNAFAANDPESTFQVLDKTADLLPSAVDNVIGILNLRADRMPRTMQWISALESGGLRRFRRLFVAGNCSRAILRRLPGAHALRSGTPEKMMDAVCRDVTGPAIIFGLGNIKGAGRSLVEHWTKTGVVFEA